MKNFFSIYLLENIYNILIKVTSLKIVDISNIYNMKGEFCYKWSLGDLGVFKGRFGRSFAVKKS
jgi:hypothetical protein